MGAGSQILQTTLRFSRCPDVDGIWTDIQDGITSKLSMVM
jgi:hypothetical protein